MRILGLFLLFSVQKRTQGVTTGLSDWWYSLLRREGVLQLCGDHTAKPTWEGVRWSTGEENTLVKHQIEDVQCSFHPGHRTLALYPLEAVRGCVGVCPTVYSALWTWRRYSTAVLGVSCERCFGTIGYFAVVKGQLVPVQLP